jgi:hypothetical protein
MKTYLITLLILLFFIDSKGQNDSLVLENSKWNILRESFNPQSQDNDKRTETILFKTDTTINDTLYKNVYQSFKKDNAYSLIGQVRQDSEDKIFFRPIIYNKEFLLYDFGLEVGDSTTIICWSSMEESQLNLIEIKVDSIVPTTLDGVNRIKYHISSKSRLENEWYTSNVWLSGIGDMEGILYSCHDMDVGGVDLKQLLCYHIDESLIFKNSNYNTCYVDNATFINNQRIENIIFYDNATNNLIFETDYHSPKRLIIVDTIGRIVLLKEIGSYQNSIDISFLPNGIYISKIIGHNINSNLKFLKK